MKVGSIGVGLTLVVAMLAAACESGRSGEGEPDTSGPPQWQEPDPDRIDPTPPTLVDAGTITAPPVAFEEDAAGSAEPTFIPLVDRSVSLKERYHTGERVRREMRLQRSYRVVVQSGRAASVQGGTSIERAYTLDVIDALGGQIIEAAITVESDQLRSMSSGEEPTRVAPSSGSLEGVRFGCRLNAEAGFDCDVPVVGADSSRPTSIAGIVPQRAGAHPGRPASVGDTWEISGIEARYFLGIEGVEATVTFIFDDNQATYRDQPCHHITYTFSGTQPLRLSGRTLGAELSGFGELYHCRGDNLFSYHRQERDLSAQVTSRPGQSAPMERVEHIVFEEETTVQSAPGGTGSGGP